MNAPVEMRSRSTDGRVGIIDCDIHPFPKPGALNAYLSERWRKHLFEYGKFGCGPYADRGTYPDFSQICRAAMHGLRTAGRRDRTSISCASSYLTVTTLPMVCWNHSWAAILLEISMRRRRCAER